MAEFIPPAFKTPDAKDDVLDWVRELPLDPQDKKQLLLDWASLTGTSLTADEIRGAAPGLLADEGETT